MTRPQPAIFIDGSAHHHYLEYNVGTGADMAALKRAIVKTLSAAETVPADSGVNMVVAFGPALWARLDPGGDLKGFSPFQRISGVDGREAPATQRDILIWLHGARLDETFDGALTVQRRLAGLAELAFDERGFTYHDSRDLTGFVDGSANPKDEAAREAALIPDGQPGVGGAFVLTQRWVHDLDAFSVLSETEQERVIGRTKPDSVELEGDAMPPDSHVSRTDVKEDGVALKIYRRSAPYGLAGEHGLYFLAFSCDLHRFDVQLKRMFGVAGDGQHDRLIAFSQAVSGSYWLAPSLDDLERVFAAD
ncbi:MAG: Dyp-type peroxidase [Rhodospirillales bacterium]|nr:Dyp-type peroxidase [Rhodospirillales bacterium]